MTATVTLGRIAGVRIGLHWSVLGVVAILAGAGFARWPEVVPGYSPVAYAVAAVAGAVLFLVSLLAHELSHALVARGHGVAVDGITLWLLGGVARLRGEASSPGAELRIAGVGPLASVVVAVLFGLLAWVSTLLGITGLVIVVLSFLTLINVVLAIFNLIPAAPLDGGRILRSALWAWRGDRYRAAVWSARAGKGFGFGLIVLGGVWVFTTAGPDGIWWILIGLFIVTVATVEEQQARTSGALAGVRVRDAMTSRPYRVDGSTGVTTFLSELAPVRKHSAFPVVDVSGRPCGLVSVEQAAKVRPERRHVTTLAEVADSLADVPVVGPDEALTDVLPRLDGSAGGRALVVEDGALAGILTSRDVSVISTLRGLDGSAGGRGAGTIFRPAG
ncbi:site-2 protease family protein [Haloechinothrix sp. YIM 98757]|uniref:Zinc metalloprotease n=1 Tax=Haloechinothrix aidingensis TaxID=2752311 RepID=A0A838AF37_9PSEU|nr:site-2 protease family protein [Haloechinothrix aidingensis]MBA0127765.1 site-2 protease family protein [Haloechinothrix aidingensis]